MTTYRAVSFQEDKDHFQRYHLGGIAVLECETKAASLDLEVNEIAQRLAFQVARRQTEDLDEIYANVPNIQSHLERVSKTLREDIKVIRLTFMDFRTATI